MLLTGLLLYCLASVLSLSHLQRLSVLSSVLSAFFNPVREALSQSFELIITGVPTQECNLFFTETLVLTLILNESTAHTKR